MVFFPNSPVVIVSYCDARFRESSNNRCCVEASRRHRSVGKKYLGNWKSFSSHYSPRSAGRKKTNRVTAIVNKYTSPTTFTQHRWRSIISSHIIMIIRYFNTMTMIPNNQRITFYWSISKLLRTIIINDPKTFDQKYIYIYTNTIYVYFKHDGA